MRDLLARLNISGFDAGAYIDQHRNNVSALPNVGMAFSGGGWRALINGAGVLKAADSRTSNATSPGHIGGLLQSSTYIAGLSGGNWLVGSVYMNNFSTIDNLQYDTTGQIWKFGNSVLEGPPTGGIQLLNTAAYYADLQDAVSGKRDAGFNTSITDYWGRALSYQLINAPNGGPAYTWSSIAQSQGFQNASQPFPISIADARRPGEKIISINSSVYEFNPYEMGTWDSTAYGFIPTQYLGTNFTNGRVANQSQCVVGFDNAGFVMGTSSSLFNAIILQLNSTANVPTLLRGALETVLNGLGQSNNDIADYRPNPFYQWNVSGNNYNAGTRSLTLVDGGLDNQNIPFHPLIQPVRNVDVIFANDNSADTSTNWPNGSSLVTTYQRAMAPISNGTGFPSIPDTNTFVNLGLNNRPTFFGCNASNITLPAGSRQNPVDVPLIVYLPNAPYNTMSNPPTFTSTTNNTYRDAMVVNGYNVATGGNATIYKDWPQCLACAILSRSFTRTGTPIPQACQQCFTQYCWNGTVDSRTPNGYNPPLKLGQQQQTNVTSGATALSVPSLLAMGVAVHALAVLMI